MPNDGEEWREHTNESGDSIEPHNELETLKSSLRWAQESQALAVRILTLLNRQMTGKGAIRDILRMVKDFTGFEAVAIRLRDGDDFPYFVTNGFPDDFVEAENHLCIRNAAGEIIRDPAGIPVLECMCGNILCGRTNPSFSFFTEGGSFWSCHTTELLATTTDADRQARTRNRCNSVGYESVALVPLRSDRETIGLLQLNDSRKGCFTLDMIKFFEGIGASIGIVLARVRAEEALRKSGEELETKVEERTEELRKANEQLQLDITERKRAEEALKMSEERYKAIFDNVSVGIDMVDDKGRFLQVNDALTEMLGYSREELLNLTFFDVSHPDDVILSRMYHDNMVLGKAGAYQFQKRYVKKDGCVVWADVYVSTLRDSTGGYVATIGVISDITQRVNAEAERERLASAIEQAAEVVVVTDVDGNIRYVNPAFEKVTGYTRTEALGRNPRLLKSGEHDRQFYKQLWDTIKGGHVWSGRLVNRRKDGRLYHEEGTISPVKDASGNITNFVAVKRDITEHLELSRQLLQAQKMEAVGTLAGGVAHDFNNILQVALGYSELTLGDEGLPEHLRADVRKIHESAGRGADLVRRLLTFSRKMEIKPQPLDLNRRINDVRKMLERTIPKMIDIQLLLGEDLARINADPIQIDQVLMNLAVNARDAMPDGGKLIVETSNILLDEEYAKVHLEAKPGRHVVLMVTDTGSGMDKDTLEHIFEPFYTTKSVGEGTGLGLAMVHGIVKHHAGHIRCYSEPGEGTTFKIYFPALISDEEQDETTAGEMPLGGSETILLVDDEEFIRDFGSRILTNFGYTVITACSGKEALEVYERRGQEIDLVVLDFIMPEMGGRQCLEGLLELNPEIKVIIASGYSANGPTKDAIEAGAKGFVNKPYDIRKMLEVVRGVLDTE